MDLLFIGDSLIEFYDWQSAFPAHRIENLGRAGETVEELLARAPQVTASRPAPDGLLVMSGTNNLAGEDYGFLPGYEKVLGHFGAAFPATRIAVNSLLPLRLPWLSSSAVPRLNEGLAALAARKGSLFIDAYSTFLAADRPLDALLFEDGVHLRPAAYRLWAKVIAACFCL
jgi:lysophospholipase L1-like esterase